MSGFVKKEVSVGERHKGLVIQEAQGVLNYLCITLVEKDWLLVCRQLCEGKRQLTKQILCKCHGCSPNAVYQPIDLLRELRFNDGIPTKDHIIETTQKESGIREEGVRGGGG